MQLSSLIQFQEYINEPHKQHWTTSSLVSMTQLFVVVVEKHICTKKHTGKHTISFFFKVALIFDILLFFIFNLFFKVFFFIITKGSLGLRNTEVQSQKCGVHETHWL